MKVHKFTVYVTDFENVGVDRAEGMLDDHPDLNSVTAIHEATKEVDWHDEIDLNQSGTSVQAYRKLFE